LPQAWLLLPPAMARQHDAIVSLKVYNLLGQKIKTLVDVHRPAGSYIVTWDGRDDRGREVSSGVYFYQLQTEESTSVKKMVFQK
jgi:flagellar hook assembly protein FlgD